MSKSIVSKSNILYDWSLPPRSPAFAIGGEVHVWRATLDLPDQTLARLERTLSLDERERAGRFYFPRDRRSFIAARGILRNILSRYLQVSAAELSFCYEAKGKPALTGGLSFQQIRFNLSHSHGIALCAVANHANVGIDVERIQPAFADGLIAESFFTEREIVALRELPPDSRASAFFNLWTAKEAYLKSKGEGIANGIRSFELTVSSDGSVLPVAESGEGFSFYMLAPADQFAAALVIEGRCDELHLFDWNERMRETGNTVHSHSDSGQNFDLGPSLIVHSDLETQSHV